MNEEKEEMSQHEALRIALSEMHNALDEIAQMPEGDVQYLKTSADAIREAIMVIDEMMREL
jgi:hypothetical protein